MSTPTPKEMTLDAIRSVPLFASLDDEATRELRSLLRTRRELRQQVEQALRKGSSSLDGRASVGGLSDAQIALCFEYASEDAPIDLDKLLPETHAVGRKPESKKP